MVSKFNITTTPRILFGSGKINLLPKLIEQFGNSVLLVTGKQGFLRSAHWEKLLSQLESSKIFWQHFLIDREPTPEIIDTAVDRFRVWAPDAIVAIGGGSVLDSGKAISAMLCQEGSVKEFLEGVGTKLPSGQKMPFIAIPTTSGTGSEATKNAVISEVGEDGYKKSLRHDNFVPNIALIDPELAITCPQDITAQSGMDAFTQLLESYLSTNANPFTDALAVDGIRRIRDGLPVAFEDGENIEAREKLAYAAMLSGITLANAGLGTVHGFASSLGGLFDIPHGLVCARMMGPVNQLTVKKLRKVKNEEALYKYARIGKLFSQDKQRSDSEYISILLDLIDTWMDKFNIRRLAEFGIESADFDRILEATDNKYNPIALNRDELREALIKAL